MAHRVVGGERPIKTPRTKKVEVDEQKLEGIIQQYTEQGKQLSYREDWPSMARRYYGVKKRISRKKIDRLYNYCKGKFRNKEGIDKHGSTS